MDRCGGYSESEFVADFYDFLPGLNSRGDLEFYRRMAVKAEGPVLECACGTGRLLIPIAREGVEITGFDLSEPMLARCRQRLEDEPDEVRANVELYTADMRNFDFGEKFKLIFVAFRSFQHLLTIEDQISYIKCARQHLSDDGRLIIDIFNPDLEQLLDKDKAKSVIDDTAFGIPDGRNACRQIKVDKIDQTGQKLHCRQVYNIIFPDGSRDRQEHKFIIRYLFRFEAEHLLARCGFEVENIYGDFAFHPFSERYNRELILIVKKTER